MRPSHQFARCAAIAFLCLLPLIASAQTLNINNDVQTYATLANTAVTLSGKAELRITGTGDPIVGCMINLTSVDAWFFMTNIVPSTVSSTFLSRVRVNGAAAVVDSNVRVVQYGAGAVVIPHAPTFAPMTVYDGKSFTGASKSLTQYTAYGPAELGSFNDAISSFKLKRGYTATLAQNPDGSGISKNYVAADGDLEIGLLHYNLNNAVSFIRIFPWRWVSKKGSCDVGPTALNADWYYNWSISSNSTLDWEYVAIKQQPYWPGLNEDWKWRGVNHLLGYNEPNNSSQDAYKNLNPQGSVSDAVARMPELLGTGLRLGAPAVDDGGYSWIVNFVNQANAAGYRLDYVPIHYYRSYWNNNDPAGAANNLYNFLKSIHDATGKPIWLTEFNNGANWTSDPDPTVDQNKNVIEAMINMMDNTWWIERYSIYSHVEWFRQTHYDDGSITPMGAMYRDHVAPIGYVQQVPSDGISAAAHYSFDGDLRDALVNGNDAMAVGAPVFTAGKYGQAISLDGTTDYLQLAEPLGDSNDFTFTGWVYWNGGGNWQRIFDFGNGGTDNYVYLTPKSGINTLRFGLRDSGTDQFVETTALPTGTWTHVAVVIADTTAKIFVNGTLRATNTAFTFDPGALDTKFNYLGKSQWPDPLFSGKLDDVRFFTTALSDAQIAAIAANAPPQFGATLYTASATKLQQYTGSMAPNATGGNGTRTFTKVAGPAWLAVAANGALTGVPGVNDGGVNRFLIRVTDSIGALSTTTLDVTVAEASGLVARYAFDGNANASVGTAHGVTTGSPAYVAGHSGQAIDLDGTDDFVTLPAGVASTDEITIAAWVNWDGGNAWQRIFDFGNGTGENFFLTPKSSANTLRFVIGKEGTAGQELNAALLPTGAWRHVAVTLGAGIGRLYVNGSLVNTNAAMTLKPSDIAAATNFIGKSQWPDPLFNGRVDDFVIFNTVLTTAQISALMNGHAPAFTADPISKPAATAGSAYNQSLALNANDPDAGSVLTFSKVSGPAWLIVGADGRLSGLPAANDVGVNRFIVRVTDQTLLADDAVVNISVGAASAGLVTQYQFNGMLTNTAGSGAGTPTGSPVYEAGVFDQALGFDGSDDLVTLPTNIASGLTDATLAVRVRWDGGGAWQRVFDFGNGTANYIMLTPSSGGAVQFAIVVGGSGQTLTGTAPLPVGEWTHVAVTLIGNIGTLYVNGAVVASGAITHNPASVPQTANYLGDSQYTADPLFNGAIDDFRIYNRGLTAAEVAALASPPAPTAVALDYTGWTTGIAFPAGQSGAAADPEGDGLINGFEFLLGLNPLATNSNALPTAQVRTAAQLGIGGDPAKTYLALQIRVRKQRPGITLTPESASTLAGLATPVVGDALQAGAPISDGDYEIITYYRTTSLEDSPSGFLRVRVTVQ